MLPVLSANPLEIVRSFPTTLVPLNQIKVPEGLPEDEIFRAKYTAFLVGKAPIHNTRMSLTAIRRGFWKWSDQRFDLLGGTPSPENVGQTKEMIRLGSRPVLHIYENPNKSDNTRYVCTDDTAPHAAYEALGIAVVPVALMGKPRDTEESCISVRSLRKGPKEWIPLVESIVPVTHQLVPSLLGIEKPPLRESLSHLLQAIETTKKALRRFHQPGAVKLHYHHTLYSVLLRAEETVDSMLQLAEHGRVLVAASLLRPLYELVLTFYIDWLSPDHTYRYLQLVSVMAERDWQASCDKEMRELVTKGLSPVDAKNIRDAHMRGYRLCSVVSEKARVFPLGETYHRDIYSMLSDILHHDFSMNARYTHTLDHGDEAVYVEDARASLLHVADILVAAIVSRIGSDIGLVADPGVDGMTANPVLLPTGRERRLSSTSALARGRTPR